MFISCFKSTIITEGTGFSYLRHTMQYAIDWQDEFGNTE